MSDENPRLGLVQRVPSILRRAGTALAKLAALPTALSILPRRSRFRDAIANQLEVPVIAKGAETLAREAMRAEFARLAEEGHWPEVLSRLRHLDQTRERFPAGLRAYRCALDGILAPVMELLAAGRIAAAEYHLPRLEGVQKAHPDDYTAAAILAQAYMEIGWGHRGEAFVHQTPASDMRRFVDYFHRAEAVLSRFDSRAENSSMLAATRFLLVAGVKQAGDRIEEWHEQWASLDPDDPRLMDSFSRFLLPQWFGDLTQIELEARRAVARCSDTIGAGAYTIFWLCPLDAVPEAVAALDTELFLQGIDQLLDNNPTQHMANWLAAELHAISSRDNVKQADATGAREILRDGLHRVIREYLREVQPDLWEIPADAVLAIICEAFEAELAAGAVIRPGQRGLEAISPVEAP